MIRLRAEKILPGGGLIIPHAGMTFPAAGPVWLGVGMTGLPMQEISWPRAG